MHFWVCKQCLQQSGLFLLSTLLLQCHQIQGLALFSGIIISVDVVIILLVVGPIGKCLMFCGLIAGNHLPFKLVIRESNGLLSVLCSDECCS